MHWRKAKILWIENQDCQYRLNATGTLKLLNCSVVEIACALLIWNTDKSVVWPFSLAQQKSWSGNRMLQGWLCEEAFLILCTSAATVFVCLAS